MQQLKLSTAAKLLGRLMHFCVFQRHEEARITSLTVLGFHGGSVLLYSTCRLKGHTSLTSETRSINPLCQDLKLCFIGNSFARLETA